MNNKSPKEPSFISEVKKLVLWFFAPVLLLASLPLLIQTGAIGPLVILGGYFGLLQLDKLIKSANPPSVKVLVQALPSGMYVLYDYYSLNRLTQKEYRTRESALFDLKKTHPDCKYETS